MTRSATKIDVYLEIGKKRTFAGALDWPGWSRSGRDEESALQALCDYGSRYGHILRGTRLEFHAPADASKFVVVEQLEGNATTDFGAPGIAPSGDAKPVNAAELQRLQKILKACWRVFDETVESATGKALRTGPRGGGRQVEEIIHHLLDSDAGYIAQVGWKFKRDNEGDLENQLEQTRQAILDGLTSSVHGEIPEKGPRGGTRWKPRYFVRRIAWHVLDHIWEIEDRVLSS